MANRYRELISKLPQGSFYDAAGGIIPYRGTSPYEFLFSPVTPLATFALFVNDQFRGEVTSDALGTAIVRVILDQGRQDIVLVQKDTQARFPTYVDVRLMATAIASHADAIETIDASLDEVEQSMSLETATSRYIEDIYGKLVQQPNDLPGWLLESYRRLLRWLRQAFRTYGSKLLGLRQTVAAFTSSLPLRVPREWRPNWTLGFQLMPNGDLQGRTCLTASPLTNLNSRATSFIHAAFGGAPTIFPGPFTNPPTAQQLQVIFSIGWNGGSVTVTGTDPLGNAIAETFTPLAAQPLVALETVVGVQNFATVSGATKGVGVGGTATIGVATGRFIKIVSFDRLAISGSPTIEYLGSPDRLHFVGGLGPTIDISATSPFLVLGKGTVTLTTSPVQAIWFGLIIEPGGGYVVGNDHFLALEADDKGIVVVDLAEPTFAGGPSPRTAAQVAASINAYFVRDTRYNAVQATGTITCIAANLILNNETFTLNDGVNPAMIFRYRRTDLGFFAVTAQDIEIDGLAPDSANVVASKSSIVVNANGGALRIDAGNPTAGVFPLLNNYGGAQGNVLITDTVANVGFTHTGMAGGVDGSYGTFATGVAGLGFLPVVRFLRTSGGPLGPASTIRIHPWGADAARTVLGEPRYANALSAGATVRAVALNLPAPNRLPEVVRDVVILHAAIGDTVALTTVGFTQPSHPHALELAFDPAWRGGVVRVHGTAFGTGAAQHEDFSGTAPLIASGTGAFPGGAASSGDGFTVVAVLGGTFAGAKPGMFFVLNPKTVGAPGSLSGAFIQYVDSATQIRLEGAGLGGLFAGGYQIYDTPPVAKGLLAFATITQWVNLTPQIARPIGPDGFATLSIVDGKTYGYNARVGRNLRQSGTGGAGRAITPLDLTGHTAVFQDSTTPLNTEYLDLEGFLLIQGATADGGANNGLHRVFSLGTPTVAGINALFIQHQDYDRGGRFAPESPLPGPATWRLYSVGDLVRVVGKDPASGDLTLYPPGLTAARASGDLVELASEMPFTQFGLDALPYVNVAVDRDFIPTPPKSDTIVVSGQVIPDGWRALNQAGPAIDQPGYFGPRRLELLGNSVDSDGIGARQALQAELPLPVVLAYRGIVLRASFWVQNHMTPANQNLRVDFSFDGVVFVPGVAVPGSVSANPEPVPGTFLFGINNDGALDPHLVEAQAEVPYNATHVVVRLVHEGVPAIPPPFAIIAVEKCIVVATNAQGLFLGDNTIPRSAQREKFGEVLYVWSSEPLNEKEKSTIGIGDAPASFPITPGQIDNVVNAHGYWERFDVSEYSGSPPVAKNVKGTYDELMWMAATLTNMEVVIGTPPRMSLVRPSFISLVEGERLTIVAPSNATLAQVTAHEGPFPEESFLEERLLEDGLPVPATPSITGGVLPWRFLGPAPSSTLQIASVAAGDPGAQAVYNSSATYTADYRRMIRAEPGPFDLGAGFGNYLWLVDSVIYRRSEPSSTPFSRVQQLVFLSNFHAPLDVRGDQDQTASTLVKDTGLIRSNVPNANWRYVDAATVEIDSTVFDPNSIYSLTYNALEPEYPRPAVVVIETRSSSVSLADVLVQTYRVVQPDEVVNRAHRYHQLRVTIHNVVDGRMQIGSGTASIDGKTVTLTAGSFLAGVQPGRVFKIESGSATGKAAHILSVSGGNTLKLDTDLGAFEGVDWEVRTFLHGTDIEVAGLGLRGINLYGTPPNAPGIITP